jgi:hypothetical protein
VAVGAYRMISRGPAWPSNSTPRLAVGGWSRSPSASSTRAGRLAVLNHGQWVPSSSPARSMRPHRLDTGPPCPPSPPSPRGRARGRPRDDVRAPRQRRRAQGVAIHPAGRRPRTRAGGLGCFACHTIAGGHFPPASSARPDLTDVGAHGRSVMPDVGKNMSVAEVIDLVAFLSNLRAGPVHSSAKPGQR